MVRGGVRVCNRRKDLTIQQAAIIARLTGPKSKRDRNRPLAQPPSQQPGPQSGSSRQPRTASPKKTTPTQPSTTPQLDNDALSDDNWLQLSSDSINQIVLQSSTEIIQQAEVVSNAGMTRGEKRQQLLQGPDTDDEL